MAITCTNGSTSGRPRRTPDLLILPSCRGGIVDKCCIISNDERWGKDLYYHPCWWVRKNVHMCMQSYCVRPRRVLHLPTLPTVVEKCYGAIQTSITTSVTIRRTPGAICAIFWRNRGSTLRDSAATYKNIVKIKDSTKKSKKSPNWGSVAIYR